MLFARYFERLVHTHNVDRIATSAISFPTDGTMCIIQMSHGIRFVLPYILLYQ
jgi:hypothetical protein